MARQKEEKTAGAAATPPSLPPFASAALMLDLDGTLIDFAPTPDAVVVPPALPQTLLRLRARLGGALAIVSGRPVEQVDALLPGIATAVAGEHGAAMRLVPDGPILRPDLPEPPRSWLDAAERLAGAHPGVLLERKRRGFVLHFRRAPAAGPALHDALAALLAGSERRFELMPAELAWEIRPIGVDKGAALRALLAVPPFAGRTPVYVGDDVTDRDAIAAAIAAGGVGLLVGDWFAGPAGVRAWLAAMAAAPDGRAGSQGTPDRDRE